MAALLISFDKGGGTVPLVIMVALLASIFVIPTNTILGLPFIGTIARKMGIRPTGAGRAERLSESLQSSRYARRLNTPGTIFGRDGKVGTGSGIAGGGYGESTVNLVMGAERIFGEGAGRGERIEDYDLIAKGDELDGANAMEPGKGEDLDDAVRLNNKDLIQGIGFADGSGADGERPVAKFENLKGFAGLSSQNKRFRAGGRAVGAGDNDLLASTLKDKTKVPGTGRSTRLRGGGKGRLKGGKFRKLNSAVSANMGRKRGGGRPTAMYQLAEGRAYSMAAAPPPGECDPSGGCPAEYAANTAGVVYDGSEPNGGILTATALGETANPNIPSQGTIDTLLAEGNQVEEDLIACEEANEKYGPLIDTKNAEIDAQSQELNNAQCGGGGCSKSKLRRCEEIEGRMKRTCNEMNALQQAWMNACPLSDGKFDAMKCTR